MTPKPVMSLAEVRAHHLKLGVELGIPDEILSGFQSHAPKWHAYSILRHVDRVVWISQQLVASGATDPSLIVAASWHDVGKVRITQFCADGPTFYCHEKVGAAYLASFNSCSHEVIDAVRYHGSLRSLDYESPAPDAGPLWLWLELCDELGKWSNTDFPPGGSRRTRAKRAELLHKLIFRGLSPKWVLFAERVAEAGPAVSGLVECALIR